MTAKLEDLRSAIELACKPQNTHRIMAGRQLVLEMPRPWVLKHFEGVTADVLDLGDYWEYRRLLELAEQLDTKLLQRLVTVCLGSSVLDVREAAEDFNCRLNDKQR